MALRPRNIDEFHVINGLLISYGDTLVVYKPLSGSVRSDFFFIIILRELI